jgi:deazaflavin-dependent oxidoreductase (nitroreductase family)
MNGMKLYGTKPTGWLRLGFRLPIWLYHWRMGWLLGRRFLMLSHVGRKSGLIRQTVIEVVSHDEAMGIYYVVSGFGRKSDWFQNILKTPKVKVMVGNRPFDAIAEVTSQEKAVSTLQEYATLHPLAFKELSKLLLGEVIDPTPENCKKFIHIMPMVGFVPQ